MIKDDCLSLKKEVIDLVGRKRGKKRDKYYTYNTHVGYTTNHPDQNITLEHIHVLKESTFFFGFLFQGILLLPTKKKTYIIKEIKKCI